GERQRERCRELDDRAARGQLLRPAAAPDRQRQERGVGSVDAEAAPGHRMGDEHLEQIDGRLDSWHPERTPGPPVTLHRLHRGVNATRGAHPRGEELVTSIVGKSTFFRNCLLRGQEVLAFYGWTPAPNRP